MAKHIKKTTNVKKAAIKEPARKTEEQVIAKDKVLLSKSMMITGLIIVVLLGIVLFVPGKSKTTSNTPTPTVTQEKPLSLPAGWSYSKETPPGVETKLEKKTETKLKPNVVVIKSVTKEKDSKAYIEKLIEGAKAALVTLTITDDTTTEENGMLTRSMSGYYYNGFDQVFIKQQITVKGTDVYTITASYDKNEANIDTDLSSLFALLTSQYIR
jgi:hypothetical protein